MVTILKPQAQYNADEFYQASKDLGDMKRINMNDPVKAAQDLGELVADDKEKFASFTLENVANIKNTHIAEMQGRILENTLRNYQTIIPQMPVGLLHEIAIKIPGEKSIVGEGYGEAIGAIEALRAQTKEINEDPEKFINQELDDIKHPVSRDIVERYMIGPDGETNSFLYGLMQKAKHDVTKHFVQEDGTLDANKLNSYVQAHVQYYASQESDEGKAQTAGIANEIAEQNYRFIAAKKQRAEAEAQAR